MNWQSRMTEIDVHLKNLKQELKDVHQLNTRLSMAYLRIRHIIGSAAFETPHAPTPEQVWDTTERALHDRLSKQGS